MAGTGHAREALTRPLPLWADGRTSIEAATEQNDLNRNLHKDEGCTSAVFLHPVRELAHAAPGRKPLKPKAS